MKVAIRDDDACFFTPPEELERVYHDVWDRVPVCLATVPFVIGYERAGIPPEHWRSGIAFPLARNAALVGALREWIASRRVTVALHGYSHEDFPSGFEFQAAPDPDRRVRDGLQHLAATIGTRPTIFVPPHNALSKRGLAAVSRAGLNLLGSFLSFRPSLRPWDAWTLANWWRVRRVRARTGRSKRDRFVYPFVLRYGRHAEFGCHSLVPGTTADQLVAAFEEARRLGGDFCIATHYWEVDATLKDVLRRVLDHCARRADVRFVAAEELFA
jgi:peptidoglycan/xylan/chitin deacetylase (PgdA/CDA1 family)